MDYIQNKLTKIIYLNKMHKKLIFYSSLLKRFIEFS